MKLKKEKEPKPDPKVRFETIITPPRIEFKNNTEPRVEGHYSAGDGNLRIRIGKRESYGGYAVYYGTTIEDTATLQTLYRQLHQILQHMGKLPCVD